MLSHRIPFLRILLFYVLGILGYKIGDGFAGTAVLGVSYFAALLLLFFNDSEFVKYKSRKDFFGIFLALFLSSAAFLNSFLTDSYRLHDEVPSKCKIICRIKRAPVLGPKSVRCLISFRLLNDSAIVCPAGCNDAFLYLPVDDRSSALMVGDSLWAYAKNFAALGGADSLICNTNVSFLQNSGVCASLYANSDSWSVFSHDDGFSIFYLSSCLQSKFSAYISNVVGDESGVVQALLVGRKDLIDDDIRYSYSVAGASHVLAVSGMHLGIIYVFLSFLLSKLIGGQISPNRQIRSSLLILFLWFYALLTGLSVSVIRAATLFTVFELAVAFSLRTNVCNTLAFSAFLVLLFSPFSLFDVGFLLSYSAFLSLVCFAPKLVSAVKLSSGPAKYVWNIVSATIAAQLFTAPFVLFFFHQLSPYFILSALVVIPLATVLIYLAVFSFLFSCVPLLSSVLSFLLTSVVSVMNSCVGFINSLPYANVSCVHFSLLMLILSLFALIFLLMFCSWSRPKYLILSLSFFVCVVSISTVSYFRFHGNSSFLVCNISGSSVVNVFSTDQNILYCGGNKIKVKSRLSDFWADRSAATPADSDFSLLSFGGKSIYVLSSRSITPDLFPEKVHVDYLVISNNICLKSSELSRMFDFETLIVDSSNSLSTCNWWSSQSASIPQYVHIVPTMGHYFVTL